MNVELAELEPLPGRRLPIESELTIGRQGCDVTVASPQVSRRHAQIAPSGDGAEITDLGSRNGTFVNDARIAGTQVLAAGDRVSIGETVWEIEVVEADAATELKPRGDVPAPPSGAHDVPDEMRAPAPAAQSGAPSPPAPPAPPAAEPPPASPQPAVPAASASAPGGALAAPARPGPSAARRMEATLISYAVVVLTAIGVVLYLVTR